jgi:hypothetical protein
MVRNPLLQILLLVLLLVQLACFEPPVFPDEPVISYNNITYTDVEGGSDSLILTFNFEDGNGDIGLNPDDVYPPFHSFNYIVHNPDDWQFVRYGETEFVLPMGSFSNVGIEYMGEYPFEGDLPLFGCEDYRIETDLFADSSATDRTDTLLIEKNRYNKNMYVDFYRKVRGEYFLINNDFSQGSCIEFFNSRIPVFDEENMGRTLSGTISFAMLSQGFKTTFRNDSIKLSFFIYDRGLNKSNVASTPDFVLSAISKN